MASFLQAVRMAVRILSFTTGLLLIVLWMRSFGMADVVTIRPVGKTCQITSVAGEIVLLQQASIQPTTRPAAPTQRYERIEPSAAIQALPAGEKVTAGLGFTYLRVASSNAGQVAATIIAFPHWLLILLTSAPAAWWAISWQFRRASTDAATDPKKPTRMLGWCGWCQSNQYGHAYKCSRCGHTLATM